MKNKKILLIAIVVLISCLVIAFVLKDTNVESNVETDFEVSNINGINQLELNETASDSYFINSNYNKFTDIEKLDLLYLVDEFGIEDFNLSKSGFYTDSSTTAINIIDGVYVQPNNYFVIDVNSETGAVKYNSTYNSADRYVPEPIQRLFVAIYNYTLSSPEEEFPGFEYYDCGAYIYCAGMPIAPEEYLDKTAYDYGFLFTAYDAVQLLQAAYNSTNTFMNLYPDYNIYLTTDSMYFDALNELSVLSATDVAPPGFDSYVSVYDEYAYKINLKRDQEIESDINTEFIKNLGLYLPSDYIYTEVSASGDYLYTHFYTTDTGFSIRSGLFNYDELAEHVSKDYPEMIDYKPDFYVDTCEYKSVYDNTSHCDPNQVSL